jgi:hypothetical protein
MTAPDHSIKPLKNLLRERGHPYMDFGRAPATRATDGLIFLPPFMDSPPLLRGGWHSAS